MGIFSILIFVLTDIFIGTLNEKNKSEATSTLSQDAKFIISKLQYDIRNANSILSPELGLSDSNLTIVLYGQALTYSSQSGNLVLNDGTANYNLNSAESKISYLNFERIGNPNGKNSIHINIRLESLKKVINIPQIINLETTVGLR